MAEVQLQLEQKKIEFNERMAKCREREDHLTHKQTKLNAEAAKFQLFLKENDAKRARALKRAQEEANLRKVKEKEAEGLREEMSETMSKLDHAKDNLEAGMVYQVPFHSISPTFKPIVDPAPYALCPVLSICQSGTFERLQVPD
jgi:hypothetical protein